MCICDDVNTELMPINLSLQRKLAVRHKMDKLKNFLLIQPGAVEGDQPLCPLKHSFGDGIYIREIFIPKGFYGVTKIHKKTHPYFIMVGKVKVVTEEGDVVISAPFQGITPAGTRRALIALEDTIWITVHSTKETDLEKIEEEIIAKSFDELEGLTGGNKCLTGSQDQLPL